MEWVIKCSDGYETATGYCEVEDAEEAVEFAASWAADNLPSSATYELVYE